MILAILGVNLTSILYSTKVPDIMNKVETIDGSTIVYRSFNIKMSHNGISGEYPNIYSPIAYRLQWLSITPIISGNRSHAITFTSSIP